MEKLVLAFFIAHFFIFPLGKISHGASATIISSSQTPCPEICNHFMGNSINIAASLVQTKFLFRDLAIQVTLNQAFRAHQLVSSRAKLPWNDYT
ncbi:hypothetical protein CRYUN_Cryun21dG0040800 [Craigia yunnanensis]